MSFDIPGAKQHLQFMQQAYLLAEKAYDDEEVPVGAVVVKDQQVIGKGYNQTERLADPTAHAEMLAISAACSTLQQKYLKDCTLYVTLEPCPMCTGAMVWSKLDTVVIGAWDPNGGACGSVFNLSSSKKLNHQVHVLQGYLENECEWILKKFFNHRR